MPLSLVETIYDNVTRQAAAETVLGERHRSFDTSLSNMAQGLLMFDANLLPTKA